jgi:hypothetical protein
MGVGVYVGDGVGVKVGVLVAVDVGVAVFVAVGVTVAVAVCVTVGKGVSVEVGVDVGSPPGTCVAAGTPVTDVMGNLEVQAAKDKRTSNSAALLVKTEPLILALLYGGSHCTQMPTPEQSVVRAVSRETG